MGVLADNIKNLGARIKQIDKKMERRIKDITGGNLKEQVSNEALENPLFEFRKAFSAILNLKLHDHGCYIGLPCEEWAVKIMVNLLSILAPTDAKLKDNLILGQNAFIKDSEQNLDLLKALLVQTEESGQGASAESKGEEEKE